MARDPAEATSRVYTFTFAAVDAYGNYSESGCRLAIGAAIDNTCDGIDDDNDGVFDEDYEPRPTTCGVGQCAARGQLDCIAGSIVDSCVRGIAGDELCGSGIDEDCDGETDEGFDVGDACSSGIGACENGGIKICVADGGGTECDA